MTESIGRTTRSEFMSRVREALGRSAHESTPVPPAIDEDVARLASDGDDLVAMFQSRATAVGMNVHRVAADAVATEIASLLKSLNAKTAALAVGEKSAEFDLANVVVGAGVSLIEEQGDARVDRQFDVDAGVTDVAAALAETGTLVIRTDEHHGRGESLIPTHHIAIVRDSDIVPDMLDWWPKFNDLPAAEMPSSMALVTGPSKTADIEGILITGVHGPASVDILLVDDR